MLTLSYFTGELIIPNLDGTNPASEAIQEILSESVAIYEPEFLRKLLGSTLADAFIVGMAASTPEAKWTALSAKIYVETTIGTGDNAKTYYQSPAAGYVWTKFVQSQLDTFTGNGITQPTFENSQATAVSRKMIRVWNHMADQALVIWDWLTDNSTTYDFDLYRDVFIDPDLPDGGSVSFLSGLWGKYPMVRANHYNPFEKQNQWGI